MVSTELRQQLSHMTYIGHRDFDTTSSSLEGRVCLIPSCATRHCRQSLLTLSSVSNSYAAEIVVRALLRVMRRKLIKVAFHAGTASFNGYPTTFPLPSMMTTRRQQLQVCLPTSKVL
jgi:hypothetical protein